MQRSTVRLAFVACLSVAAGCGTAAGPAQTDAGADGGALGDGGATGDAAPAVDGGVELDAAPPLDGGTQVDAARADAGALDAGASALGDCRTNADCPGGTCVELVPGGYRVCQTPPTLATGCDPARPEDQCCTSADCAAGICVLGPAHRFCGGEVRNPFNECVLPECTSTADCHDAVCAPAGTFAPMATCVAAACLHDTDCRDEAGGRCVVARDPCCGIPVGLVCSYPSDGCRTDADCAVGYCQSVGGRTRCVDDGGPFCPA